MHGQTTLNIHKLSLVSTYLSLSFCSLPCDRPTASSKGVLLRTRSSASYFNFQYHLVSVRSSSSCLHLLPRHSIAYILPSFFSISFVSIVMKTSGLRACCNLVYMSLCKTRIEIVQREQWPGRWTDRQQNHSPIQCRGIDFLLFRASRSELLPYDFLSNRKWNWIQY